MANLTEAQKTANKEAQRLRNAAFNSRWLAYQASKTLTEKRLKETAACAALEANAAEFTAQGEVRLAVRQALEMQIVVIRQIIEDGEDIYAAQRDALQSARAPLAAAYDAERRSLEGKVDAEFADIIAANFRATQWKSLDAFIPAGAGV